MQLQKIANSRTGGLKTDEALGKTGAGPEGLPHSIIVTETGIEGEVQAAQDNAEAATTRPAPEGDLLGGSKPDDKPAQGKSGAVRQELKKGTKKGVRGKSEQIGLFADKSTVRVRAATPQRRKCCASKARLPLVQRPSLSGGLPALENAKWNGLKNLPPYLARLLAGRWAALQRHFWRTGWGWTARRYQPSPTYSTAAR